LQGLQHEHVQGALEDVSAISHASPFDRRKKSTRGSLRLSKGTDRPQHGVVASFTM
jgi:hypothetical protein